MVVLLDTEGSANMKDFSLSFSKALMTTLNYMLTATGLNIQLGAAVEFVASSSPEYSAVVAVIKTEGGKGPTTWNITINDPAFLWLKAQVVDNDLVLTGTPPFDADGSCHAGKQIEQLGNSLGIRL